MEKVLRSLIHEKFPIDLRYKLELLSKRRDIINKEKQEELFKLLREFNVKGIIPLGPGTNRYAFRLDGFVVKVATDYDGKIDNMKEFKMAKRLFPYVTKTYEVSENGTILVAEYIQPFSSYAEMLKYADRIRQILEKLSSVYLIGDVGISSVNYSNWGLRIGTDDPVCLDFAYVYNVSSELFVCRHCNNGTVLVPNKDFTELLCPNKGCGKKYRFEDIRARLGNDIHRHEIGNLSDEGYKLDSSNVLTTLDESRSNYLMRKKKEETEKIKSEDFEDEIIDDFNLLNIKEDNEMSKKFKFTQGQVIDAIAYKIQVTTDDVEQARKDLDNKGAVVATKHIQNVAGSDVIDNNETIVVEASLQKVDEPNKNKTVYPSSVIEAESVVVFSAKMNEESTLDYHEDSAAMDVKPSEEIVSGNKSNIDLYDPEGNDEDVIEELVDEQHEDITPIVKAEVVIENNHQNEDSSEIPQNIKHSKAYNFNANFTNNIEKAISKLANRIGNHMHELLLFDHVYVRDKKMYPDTFYKSLQNAVFRSLMMFCKFTEKEVPNANGRGYHKEFTPPSEIYNTAYEPTLVFISRFWNNREINSVEEAGKIMDIYREKFDDYDGIQREWLDLLAERIKSKIPVDASSISTIIETIDDFWCKDYNTNNDDSTINEDEVEELEEIEEVGEVDEIEEIEEIEDTTTNDSNTSDESNYSSNNNLAFQTSFDNQEKLLEKHFDIEEAEDDAEEDENEDDDYEDDEQEVNSSEFTYVEIRRKSDNLKFDIVKLITADDYDTITIPFYTNLDKITTDLPKSLADQRNGVWDWMIHFMTDYRFLTANPEKWLEINNNVDNVLSIFKFVIIDPDFDDGKALMGFTVSYNVIEVDEDGNQTQVTDYDTLAKVNQLIINNCGYTEISHLTRSLLMEDIRDEEEITELIREAIDNANEMGININEEDNEEEDDEYSRDSEDAIREDAAIAAIMSECNDSSNNNETKLFTPIRRKSRN